MSVHQIIYTSCMRGIHGMNDGQQIFSYDAQFEDFNNDDIKSLFSYQPPALSPGVIMTEEIAATLPHSFIFRRLENGKCALSLSTYLGRDYMGSAGRFGNHLSHVVVADESDLAYYPCEFYGGSLLRKHMEFEEVNNPNPPDFLPIPVLEKGYRIDVEAVMEFLSVGNRLEIYKNMLYAMLVFERERKRVVICDEPENIIMWIAALEYSVPLKMALNINFTTYEFDPSLSASQICGVVENGTRYTPESKRLHFVFDLYHNDCVNFDKEPEFYDFIDTAFSLSYESIQDFHAFLVNGYTYEKIDSELYSAYALYSLISDGISGVTKKRLESALDFADKYADSSEKVRIAENMVSQYEEILVVDRRVFLTIMQYVFSMKNILTSETQIMVMSMIVDRVLTEFFSNEITEDAFRSFYNDTDRLCKQYEIGMATELMQDKNQQKLFAVMKNAVQTWKIAFIIRILSMYVKECHISIGELAIGRPLGRIYYDIIGAVYSQQPQNVYFLVTCILNEFADDSADLTDMALNIEKMLMYLSSGDKELTALWEYYGQTMLTKQIDNFSTAYDTLARSERLEPIFMLFRIQLHTALDVSMAQKMFQEHFNKYVLRNKIYASKYCEKLLEKYYEKLGDFDKEQSRGARLELFNLLEKYKINIKFSDELINDLINSVPYKSPSEENLQFIQNAFLHIYKVNGQHVTGKMLLLFVGINIEDIESCQQAKERIGKLKRLTQNGRADLTRLPEKSVEEYFAWILPKACEVCQEKNVMNQLYDLFDMSSVGQERFFSVCTNNYIKRCKEEKDISVFVEYFDFACEHSNVRIRENIGQALCRMNKKRIVELDEAIRRTFETDDQLMQYWEDIRSTSETTTPLLNGFNNLIKEGKKKISLWQKRGN